MNSLNASNMQDTPPTTYLHTKSFSRHIQSCEECGKLLNGTTWWMFKNIPIVRRLWWSSMVHHGIIRKVERRGVGMPTPPTNQPWCMHNAIPYSFVTNPSHRLCLLGWLNCNFDIRICLCHPPAACMYLPLWSKGKFPVSQASKQGFLAVNWLVYFSVPLQGTEWNSYPDQVLL